MTNSLVEAAENILPAYHAMLEELEGISLTISGLLECGQDDCRGNLALLTADFPTTPSTILVCDHCGKAHRANIGLVLPYDMSALVEHGDRLARALHDHEPGGNRS